MSLTPLDENELLIYSGLDLIEIEQSHITAPNPVSK